MLACAGDLQWAPAAVVCGCLASLCPIWSKRCEGPQCEHRAVWHIMDERALPVIRYSTRVVRLCLHCPPHAGTAEPFAGRPGSSGHADGSRQEALFLRPHGVCCSPQSGSLFIADQGNMQMRRLHLASGDAGHSGARGGGVRGA